jgi:L-ribulose-5-phosphate 3-epimerase
MTSSLDRREFLRTAAVGGAALGLSTALSMPLLADEAGAAPPFKISLAEWSFHRMLFDGELTNLEFPAIARHQFDIDCVEYVNQFFMDKAKDQAYLSDLKNRCHDNEVRSRLIMCDNEGDIGDPDKAARTKAVENHYKWVEAAKFLGCETIRVNARSAGSYDEQMACAVDGLHRLAEFGAQHGINVIVENHGGLSSNGKWLSTVIQKVGLPNCGTLPDFGNFQTSPGVWYDRYQGVREMMPYAKGVSAKSYGFKDDGDDISTNYFQMMQIVVDAGYHSYVGIEYEGEDPNEFEGVHQTKRLLERILKKMA